LPIRAPAREFSGQSPEIDVVSIAERVGTEAVLLVVMRAAEAHPKNVVRPLANTGIRGRAQMGKVNRTAVTTRHATAMRPDPAPMPRPHLLHGRAHPQLWPFQPIGQPHDRCSTSNGSSELIGGVTIAVS
jgi:hypothetical protein